MQWALGSRALGQGLGYENAGGRGGISFQIRERWVLATFRPDDVDLFPIWKIHPRVAGRARGGRGSGSERGRHFALTILWAGRKDDWLKRLNHLKRKSVLPGQWSNLSQLRTMLSPSGK
eukprot:1150744-Pyramimonas_sp.AAC.1